MFLRYSSLQRSTGLPIIHKNIPNTKLIAPNSHSMLLVFTIFIVLQPKKQTYMKKSIFILSVLGIAATVFNGCKKGEKDPFITLKSRDGRLTQTWKLSSVEGTEISTTPMGTTPIVKTTTITYNGTTYTSTTVTTGGSGNIPNTTSSATGTYEMTLDKHGKVSIATTSTSGSSTVTTTNEGAWHWLSSNKNRDHLNVSGAGMGSLFPGGDMYIERLAGKELVLHAVSKSSNSAGSNNSSDIKYTFSK